MLIPNRHRGFRTILLLAFCALVVVSGCRRRPGPVQSDPVEAQPVVEEPVVTPAPEPDPEPAPPPPPPPPPPLQLAVLLSDDLPHYESVRDELVGLAGAANVRDWSMAGSRKPAPGILAEAAAAKNVVAIGLLAAKAVEQLDSTKIVFCQVFNYQENGLPAEHNRGIETVPDLRAAISAWKELDPDLNRIGVITGPGQARRLARASATMRDYGIELVYRVTNSDKETLLEFQRLLEDIDGYWMFPDNRILSSSTIREIMSLSKRYRIGVLANDPGFHRIGALISAASRPEEIAAKAWAMLEGARDQTRFDEVSVQPLSTCSVTIRGDVAAQLGYAIDSIPEDLLAR